MLDLAWSMTKKVDGTLQSRLTALKNLRLSLVHDKESGWEFTSRLTAHRCSQKGGEHCDISSFHAPITKDTMICIMLTLMLIAGCEIQVIYVKGAFLH